MEPGHHVTDHNPTRRGGGGGGGSCAGHHFGVICALPDELLVDILLRVGDWRTAVSTSALSRRWQRLDPARWLPAFDFSVGDHLPPWHAATLQRYHDALVSHDAHARAPLARQVSACEDRAMEAYVPQLARFLRSPERYPAARSLRLEFYVTAPPPRDKNHGGDAASSAAAGPGMDMAACLASALRWPQLERLAIYAFPRGVSMAAAEFGAKQRAHDFSDPEVIQALVTASRVATLHVMNCLARSGHSFGMLFPALSRLTIEITPGVKAIFSNGYFDGLLRSCRNLVFLRLVSCNYADDVAAAVQPFRLDLSPASKLRELILETCNFNAVGLVNTPSLERLVIHKCSLLSDLAVYNAPRLATLVCRGTAPWIHGGTAGSLRFVEVISWNNSLLSQERLESFCRGIAKVEVLELCIRNRWFWVRPNPTNIPIRFENLKKLRIHLPSIWPSYWIKKLLKHLLEAATCLEKLHIQFFALLPVTSEGWGSDESADDLQHTCLRQTVMEGCTGTKGQIALTRHLLSSCPALKTILFILHHDRQMKNEKAETVFQLRDGIHSTAEIIFSSKKGIPIL